MQTIRITETNSNYYSKDGIRINDYKIKDIITDENNKKYYFIFENSKRRYYFDIFYNNMLSYKFKNICLKLGIDEVKIDKDKIMNKNIFIGKILRLVEYANGTYKKDGNEYPNYIFWNRAYNAKDSYEKIVEEFKAAGIPYSKPNINYNKSNNGDYQYDIQAIERIAQNLDNMNNTPVDDGKVPF